MRCERSRELISALLDGELADRSGELDQHLDGCEACRSWADRAQALHRTLRLQSAPEVPDLTAAILSSPPSRPDEAERRAAAGSRRARPGWWRSPDGLVLLRVLLAAIGGTQLLLGAAELVDRTSVHGHASRHLGGWGVAFAVGLLVAAAQPWRARGLLPMAGTVAGVMLLTGSVDALSGGTPGMTEAAHVLEVCGVVVLWAMSRVDRSRHGGGGARRARAGGGRWRRLAEPQWTRVTPGLSMLRHPGAAQISAVPSCAVASSSANWRTSVSRARATRERTVPMGQSHTDAVSA
jgi:predicted anti-sigma-YlaC factor YlaD